MTQSHTPVLEAIVLAAGRGVRFGGDKLLAALNGAPLITGALASALAAPVRRVLVAVGDDPRLADALQAAAPPSAADRLVLIPVPQAAEGMSASLRTAAAAASPEIDGVFVFLGDMPAIATETPVRLAAALDGPGRIVAPVHAGRRGHPVLFGGGWLPALKTLTGDQGARAVIATAGSSLRLVEVDDPGVLLDIDRPEDLAGWEAATEADGRDRRESP